MKACFFSFVLLLPLVSGGEGLPEGVYGFSGQTRGVVSGVRDDGVHFRVGRVLRVWKNNKARAPEALNGRTVVLNWRSESTERHPLHRAFMSKLRPGMELTLELYNPKEGIWSVLELNEEQRVWAGRDAPREGERPREGDRDRPRETDRPREGREHHPEGERREGERDRPPHHHRPDLEPGEHRERPPHPPHRFAPPQVERELQRREVLVDLLREELRRSQQLNAELRHRMELLEARLSRLEKD